MWSRKDSLQLYDCDRTGFTHQKNKLVRQRGLLLAPDEVDDLRRIKDIDPRWGSPRNNGTSVEAVNGQLIFTISAETGITALSQSYWLERDGVHQSFFMIVVSDGGAVEITADPPIVAGNSGDRLTLRGDSDTDYIILRETSGLSLFMGRPFYLKRGNSISFVCSIVPILMGYGYDEYGTSPYGGDDDEEIETEIISWVETSRMEGGL